MNTLNQWLQHEGLSIAFILLGAALLYYFGGIAVRFFTTQLVKGKGRALPKRDIEKREKTVSSLTVAVWRIAVGIMAGVSIIKILFPALDLSPLFASAGIVGVAVAFGSQSLVKDFLTGLFIISENQYRVGDVIEIQGMSVSDAHGRVERVGTRTTVIRDEDGNVHYVPNGSIVHVVNKTMGFSRVNFSVAILNGSDLDQAISVINQVGDALAMDEKWKKKILEAPQFDSISSFSGSSTEIKIVGKVQPSDQWSITAEMRRRLLEELEQNDIKLA